jgi:ATP-dependent DNA helicase UvrD/PcrA
MTTELLKNLNAAQQKAVQATDGPVLVMAGPGSGKTRILTHRIAYLIGAANVSPYNILAVTFTNKAAREMKERLDALLGAGRAAALTVGTFHSICTRFLRRDSVHLGRERDFAIYDSDDQQRLMKRVLKDLKLDEKKNPPRAIHAEISRAKNELVGAGEFANLGRTYHDEIVARCFAQYQKLLREANALDFDDLLVETVRLFEQHPDVLEKYQDRYRYLLADEYQDTNRVQYILLKQLAAKYRNIFVVGDDDQCVPEGSLVRTLQGEVPIERIAVGDTVVCGAGRGTTAHGRVEETHSRPYQGKLVRITLQSGRVLSATPNHMCFARLGPHLDVYYVYLMYRRDKGYRIGLTRGYRSEGRRYGVVNGLETRVRQEHADKAWILRVCADRSEATFYEQFFAITYGIPTMIFDVAGRGDLSITQETIDQLYTAIDTRSHAERLMNALGIFEDYPHIQPSGNSGSTRQARMLVHLTAFGGHEPSRASPWFRHRVWLNTTSRVLEEQVVDNGIATRSGQRATWRVERVYKELEQTSRFAEEIARAAGELDIVRSATFTSGGKFAFQPAAHLRPSMRVPMWHDGKIVDEEITTVEFVDYDGMVYDLDVAHLHNYAVSDVVVHNSVYAFRGADIRNIRSFEDDYPEAQVILLEQNYRSTQAILDVAQAVIRGDTQRKHLKKLWTENDKGVLVQIQEGYDQDEEAQLVAGEIARLTAGSEYGPGDIAIMYRTNAQSRAVEEALIGRGLRYQIVGGTRFYERKEIKDALAYLRLAHNPYDSVSFSRVLNWPARGIGERTEDELNRWANSLGLPSYVALQMLNERSEIGDTRLSDSSVADAQSPIANLQSPFNPRTKNALLGFLRIMDELIAAREEWNLGDLMDLLFGRVEFQEALLREYGEEQGRDRWNNVIELRNVAANYANLPREAQLPTFLEEVALISDVDAVKEERDSITCITLHQAKGLEYPVVFIVGLEEGLLPHSRSIDDRDALEEERRLFYVGATRARQRLYLLYAFRRTTYGRTNSSTPSRFLADIPMELIKQAPKRGMAAAQQSSMFTNRGFGSYGAGSRRALPQRQPQPTPAAQQRAALPQAPRDTSFFAGQKVRHALFGDGIVVSSKLVENDEEVTVAFTGKGVKRLLASFANLEVSN